LAHPKKMDVAVPATLKCGRPETDPDVAQIATNNFGIREMSVYIEGAL
jgi:hypothetical protein